MEVLNTNFEDAKIVIPMVFEDGRGYFKETYHLQNYIDANLWMNWAQDGVSFSKKVYTIRGLHTQPGMAKLVQVLHGFVYDVIVDIRPESKTYKKWQGFELSEKNHHQLFVPAGFLHGFMTLTNDVVFSYKMSTLYNAKTEKGIYYNCEELGIDWPVSNFVPITISDKDKNAPKELLIG